MASPRFLVEAALAQGARVSLDEAQSRHAGTVLRLGVGARLRVFNARDGEWAAAVSVKHRILIVEVGERLRPPAPAPDLVLLFAPVKRHATDLIVEKATELGVRELRPVLTQRTIADTVRLERLAAIAREAAEQTERFEAPHILPPAALAKALDGWDAARPLIYADESGDETNAEWGGGAGRARPVLEALQMMRPSPLGEGRVGGDGVRLSREGDPASSASPQGGEGKLALLVGPEGGFTGEERRMLRSLPFVTPVSLGPRILRAETAVIAALAVIQAAWGDWRATGSAG